MKLQVIRRNGKQYFHIYLPKNIIEQVLRWEPGERLTFRVIEDGLVIRRSNIPDFKQTNWDMIFNCSYCNIKASYIKGVIRGNEFVVLLRCSRCKKRKKVILPLKEKSNWMKSVEDIIKRCDICNRKSLKEVRLRLSWSRRNVNYATVVYYCLNCNLERTKLIPFEILEDIKDRNIKDIEIPKIRCIYCGEIIEDYNEVECPNCKNVIICPRCENILTERSRFCTNCGEELESLIKDSKLETQLCPFCDEIINRGAFFCERCGNLVSCLRCGAPISESTIYCGQCGVNIKSLINIDNFIEKD